MRSSPLRAVEEETGYAASVVGSDLWESASLDYPGREELYMMDQDDDFEPVNMSLQSYITCGDECFVCVVKNSCKQVCLASAEAGDVTLSRRQLKF